MRKILFPFILLSASICQAEQVRTIFNPFTNRLDYITVLTSATLPSGSTQYIQNRNTLQAGATMYVSSGTFQNRLISLSLFQNGIYGLSGQANFYGLDGTPTLYVNDEESGIGVDPFFTQNITLFAGLQPVLTVEGGAVAIQNSGFHKFMDGDNTHYYGLRSSNTLTTSNIYTLPASSGAANTALVLDGHNNYEHKGIILNTNDLQSGATFFVSSGTVRGLFTVVNSDTLFPGIDVQTPMGTDPYPFLALTNTSARAAGNRSTMSFKALGRGPGFDYQEDMGIIRSEVIDSDFTEIASRLDFNVASGGSSGSGTTPTFSLVGTNANNEKARLDLYNGVDFRYYDSDNSNYVGLKSSATLTSDVTYTLPSSSGTGITFMKKDASNGLFFSSFTLSDLPTGSTSYIHNSNTLQEGASFYVRTGVVRNGGLAFGLESVPSTITVRASAISAARTILVPNASGTLAVSGTSPISVSGTGAVSIKNPLPITNGGTNNSLGYNDNAIVISNGTSLTHDVIGFNYESATDSLGVGATATSSAFIQTGPGSTTMAPINLGKGQARSTPADADIWFTTNTNSFQTYSSDMVSPTMSVVNVSTSDTQASNIATEVTLSSHTLGTKAFAANGATAGKLIQIHAWGHYSTDAISAPDITFRIYVGTQVVGTVTTTLPTGLSKEQWSCYLNGVVRTTGTSGTFMSNGKCEYYDGTSYVGLPIVTDTAYNINWNNAQNISITGQFSAADTDNIVKATTFWWEYAY